MSEVAITADHKLVGRSPHVDAGTMMQIIADAASNPACDVTKMQALLDMQERLMRAEARASFNDALARLSAHMPRIAKNGTIKLVTKEGIDRGSIPFAKWEDMDAVIRPLMRQEGFTLSFDMADRTEMGIKVVGKLLHKGGHFETSSIWLPPDNGPGRNPLQAIGSTYAYGKRYTTEALLNLVREGADDDGQAGGADYITPQQASSIQAALDALDGDPEKFLAMFRVATFQDIHRADHGKVMNALAAKRRQQQGGSR